MSVLSRMATVLLCLTAVALPSHAESPHSGAEGSGAETSGAQTLLVELGATLFQQHCASCHGSLGRGDGPVATSLKVAPADLTRIAARREGTFPDSDVASFIDGRFELDAHGTREMPIWGRQLAEPLAGGTGDEVARGQIQSLVEYLKTIQQPAP